jgi:hypothetical protein
MISEIPTPIAATHPDVFLSIFHSLIIAGQSSFGTIHLQGDRGPKCRFLRAELGADPSTWKLSYGPSAHFNVMKKMIAGRPSAGLLAKGVQ